MRFFSTTHRRIRKYSKFWVAVKSGKNAGVSIINPILFLVCSISRPDLPNKYISPEVGINCPASNLKNVDFPAPFLPIKAQISPFLNEKRSEERRVGKE